MNTISTLKNEAREALRGNWGIAAVSTFLVSVIIGSTCGAPGLGFFFLAVPIEYGFSIAILKLLRGDNLLVDNTFSSAFDNYIHKVGTGALCWIYIFLWSLLLIVPGIIKALAYAMVPFILEDEPTLSAEETLRRSSTMMAGHKWDLFVLYLSFIGWWFLSILTLGIGFFFLTPYVRTTVSSFYEDLKG